MIDWDVAWTGSLHRILRAFDRTRADLLTFDEVKAERDDHSYLQQSLRNYLADDEVRKALIVPARYSRRMLGATKQLVASGKHCFCETRGPSLCHASRWCTQHSMQTLRPDIFGEYHCCNDIPSRGWRRCRGVAPKREREPAAWPALAPRERQARALSVGDRLVS